MFFIVYFCLSHHVGTAADLKNRAWQIRSTLRQSRRAPLVCASRGGKSGREAWRHRPLSRCTADTVERPWRLSPSFSKGRTCKDGECRGRFCHDYAVGVKQLFFGLREAGKRDTKSPFTTQRARMEAGRLRQNAGRWARSYLKRPGPHAPWRSTGFWLTADQGKAGASIEEMEFRLLFLKLFDPLSGEAFGFETGHPVNRAKS